MLKDGKWKKDIPEYQPGDKIYKLFAHHKVLVRGRDNDFVIRITRMN